MLVVAADEGVMPQTREHLSVLEVLGVRGGVVALTKSDLVEGELLEVRRREVERYLDGGPLAGAPVIPCSALDGRGVEAVRDAVLACARDVERTEDPHRPFRVAVDRVFTISGSGTVVTGTAHWGQVRAGDELTALPSRAAVRVRGVQVHGQVRDRAGAGERVALSLAGVRVDELPRGEQLLAGAEWSASRRLAVEVRLLGEGTLAEGDRVWVHILAARALARVERTHPATLGPGESGRADVHLAHPVFAVPGDRVVPLCSPARGGTFPQRSTVGSGSRGRAGPPPASSPPGSASAKPASSRRWDGSSPRARSWWRGPGRRCSCTPARPPRRASGRRRSCAPAAAPACRWRSSWRGRSPTPASGCATSSSPTSGARVWCARRPGGCSRRAQPRSRMPWPLGWRSPTAGPGWRRRRRARRRPPSAPTRKSSKGSCGSWWTASGSPGWAASGSCTARSSTRSSPRCAVGGSRASTWRRSRSASA
ncbi:MAG: hypothetical protein B7Z68_13540 [Acidobacteria bacterium 21-70-11]|nr:MAG: hypothetical protein B7Z68_13540 [Acidobacteria bacterium 21-70-11]